MTDPIDACAAGRASECSAGREAKARLASERLNAECFCMGLDHDALWQAIHARAGEDGLAALLEERCPYVFASRPVFVSAAQRARMSTLVDAIESVVALPAYQEQALARAPAIARRQPGARGVFFGYDFHVSATEIGLIEINTNAGGAMLNALLARAQRACCPPIERLFPLTAADAFEARIVAMFRNEWALGGRGQPLRTIAIVDEQPQSQYLYPEFLLFKRLFEANGWTTVIADPAELRMRGGRLHCGEQAIDLVYNRLTDFYLEAQTSAALREAWLQDAAVITPHPHAHALYADKRNLAVLSDPAQLQQLGVPASTQAILLAGIPRTGIVDPANADRLWAERKRLFFKPFAGYGGRAAYRGDKITRRVWQEILEGGYIAQALVAPGERALSAAESLDILKFDLRNYVYDGQEQWVAARLYQGQTTNFRTPGGGFAPVYEVPEGCMDAMDETPLQPLNT
jgi:hypothetical protein